MNQGCVGTVKVSDGGLPVQYPMLVKSFSVI